ncbi:lantibiotic dehydratase [Spirosoma validum]|uniref:Lantibiotic dehydratase n=1 Tax=Spirosoma validum TaxID=2771355 RepID=A0A927B1W0_9BACT|nr:lantibiotic dehydratase [Spirosoma validum]MBD2754055.1 lantibiotic dehydratase [Spirosoma validum]
MRKLTSTSYYLLRTPLKPIHTLTLIQDALSDSNLTQTDELIGQLWADPEIQEAIYIASPEFHQEVGKWLQQDNKEGEKGRKIRTSFYKYVTRACTRSTPYGLFAGCATGTITDAPTQVRFANERLTPISRLDMQYVAELTAQLINIPAIRNQLRFYPNTSLYAVGDTYRYLESRPMDTNRRYFLSAIKSTDYVTTILQAAQTGRTLDELKNELHDPDLTDELIVDFLEQLVDAQLLVSELEPTVTGDEPLVRLLRRLSELEETEAVTTCIQKIQSLIKSEGSLMERGPQLQQLITTNFPGCSGKDLLQTDLFFDTQANTLNQQVVNDIIRQVEQVLPLCRISQTPSLETFRQQFYERYEEQEVPLLLVLDSESGIGYGSETGASTGYMPLLDRLQMPSSSTTDLSGGFSVNSFKYQRLRQLLRTGAPVVTLTDDDLVVMKEGDLESVAPSAYLFGTLLAASGATADAGDYQFLLKGLIGPSAATLMARFCHGSEALTEQLKASLVSEEAHYPDAVLAEVVHLPEARHGNILSRPTLRPYEIPYLGQSSVAPEYQIPLNDLLVSVRNGRVRLRSRRLGREVIPRLSSAHNTRNGVAAYQFLHDLQYQQTLAPFRWDWGMFNDEPFLPRIAYQKLILSRARWLIKRDEYAQRLKKAASADALITELQRALNVPAEVVLAQGDNELWLRLDTEIGRQIVADQLRQSDVMLYEHLQTPDQCWVSDGVGQYANELVIPVQRPAVLESPVKSANTSRPMAAPTASLTDVVKRQFIPGSEWLYVKVYGGAKTLDILLTQVIYPLTTQMTQIGLIDQWFYVRYNDPNSHLRLRFHHKTQPTFWITMLQALQMHLNPYVNEETVVSIQTDTYRRELERYGAANMLASEQLFHQDSVAVVSMLSQVEADDDETYRWLMALRGVDQLLTDFQLPLTDKKALLERLRDQFFREFNGNDTLMRSLNDKYRESRSLINYVFGDDSSDDKIRYAKACLATRSESLRSLVPAIETNLAGMGMTKQDVLPHYIHMFLNRLFMSEQRLHELIIYHYLLKHYTSELAQQRQTA